MSSPTQQTWRRKSISKAMQLLNGTLNDDEEDSASDILERSNSRSRRSPRTSSSFHDNPRKSEESSSRPTRRRSFAHQERGDQAHSNRRRSGSTSPQRVMSGMLRRMSNSSNHSSPRSNAASPVPSPSPHSKSNSSLHGHSNEEEMLSNLMSRAENDGTATLTLSELRALQEAVHHPPTSNSQRSTPTRRFSRMVREEEQWATPTKNRRPSLHAAAGKVVHSQRVADELRNRAQRRRKMESRVASHDVHADEILSSIRTWDFNVFEAMKMIPRESFLFVGLAIFEDSRLDQAFELDNEKLIKFLLKVEHGYSDKQSYHNKMHALDVCQTVHYMVHCTGLHDLVSNLTQLVALVAALVHDIGHFGLNNAFLNQTNHDLALTYSYQSPLERMHLFKAFSILSKEDSNIFSHLPPEELTVARSLLVEMILGTDMAHHQADLTKLESLLKGNNEIDMKKPEMNHFIMRCVIHTADISNPAKEWNYYNQWSDRILKEFHAQGDKERQHQLPISPGFDREKMTTIKHKAQGQLFFVGVLVKPLYEAMAKLPFMDLDEALGNLEFNISEWKRIVEEFDQKEQHTVQSAHQPLRTSSQHPKRKGIAKAIPATDDNRHKGAPL